MNDDRKARRNKHEFLMNFLRNYVKDEYFDRNGNINMKRYKYYIEGSCKSKGTNMNRKLMKEVVSN